MLCFVAMQKTFWAVVLLVICATQTAFGDSEQQMKQRRQRAAAAFHDGILLVHANAPAGLTDDGFRQDPIFYYFTGLEDTINAVLAIDGESGESWLFLPPSLPVPFSYFSKLNFSEEADAAKRSGIEHVADWSELDSFLAKQAGSSKHLYVASDISAGPEMPETFTGQKIAHMPLWALMISQKWPSFQLTEADAKVYEVLEVQSDAELVSVRAAAKATVGAVMAGIRAIHPDVSQRSVEAAVVSSCWNAGAHGVAFWPWAMAGNNSVFPRPFLSLIRYDHLNSIMQSGDLVRLDVGCESNHYQGDLGRTVPVSGHFTADQRETWNIFVAAYHAGAQALREGVTVEAVFQAWRAELMAHQASAKSSLAQRAIATWSQKDGTPFWQVHTINLVAGRPSGPLRANTTVAFEPIASMDGQGYYLEDMYLITKTGAELLTPGVPYSAEEIESAMK
jgi:Xaa-Pro aminopeptidase